MILILNIFLDFGWARRAFGWGWISGYDNEFFEAGTSFPICTVALPLYSLAITVLPAEIIVPGHQNYYWEYINDMLPAAFFRVHIRFWYKWVGNLSTWAIDINITITLNLIITVTPILNLNIYTIIPMKASLNLKSPCMVDEMWFPQRHGGLAFCS